MPDAAPQSSARSGPPAWTLVCPPAGPQVKVTDHALTSLAVQGDGAVLAVGTARGAAHVLRLSAGLAEMAQNEKQGIAAMLDREMLRCAGSGWGRARG